MQRLECHQLLAAIVGMGCLLSCGSASAQQVVPYSYFTGLSAGQLGGVRLRIAKLSGGERAEPGLMLVTSIPADTLAPFIPFRKPGCDYFEENVLGTTVVILTPAELEAIIDSVSTVAEVADGGIDSTARMAIGLVRTDVDPDAGFESLVNGKNVTQLLGRMRGALGSNARAYDQVVWRACSRGIEFGPAPAEVTSDVTVRYSGAKFDVRKQAYAVRVSVTNDANHAIIGPMYLVLGALPPDQELLGIETHTCSIHPTRAAVVNLPIGASLARDATVSMTLFFRSKNKVRLVYDRRVFAGPGER